MIPPLKRPASEQGPDEPFKVPRTGDAVGDGDVDALAATEGRDDASYKSRSTVPQPTGNTFNTPPGRANNDQATGNMEAFDSVDVAIIPEQDVPPFRPPRLERLIRNVRSKTRDNDQHVRNAFGSERILPAQWQRVIKTIRDAYIYTGIRSDQVRLLIIQAGQEEDEINAVLHVVNDENLGSDPYPYEALSYHWGEGDPSHSILVHKEWGAEAVKSLDDLVLAKMAQEASHISRLYVRPNLHCALKRLRQPHKPIALWVDAVCINQNDDREKSDQVQKMHEIYRKAYNVCIWLGTDDSNFHSAKAMAFVKEVVRLDQLETLLNNDQYLHCWVSWYQLLKWSWFSRRWVIQELAMAQEATVHCGQSDVYWDDFRDAIVISYRYFRTLYPRLPEMSDYEPIGAKLLVDLTSDLFRRNQDGTYEATLGLESLVSRFSSFTTSDPRDTINCLRNISRELNTSGSSQYRILPPAPDYKQDLFEVYRDFVLWTIKDSYSMDIICRRWALREKESQWDDGPTAAPRLVALPSWILTVDDRYDGPSEAVFKGRKAGDSFVGIPGEQSYRASGRSQPKVIFGEYTTTSPLGTLGVISNPTSMSDSTGLDMSLTASGYLIGVVDWTCDPIPDGVIPEKALEKLGWTSSYRSPLNVAAPDQLCRTLVAGRGPNGTTVPTYYSRACIYCLQNETPNGHINTENLLRAKGPEARQSVVQDYMERVRAVTWNRVILHGKPTCVPSDSSAWGETGSLVGLGPPGAQADDVIAIFFGCSVPVILRPFRRDRSSPQLYKFIGEAYIYGKMDGEAMLEQRVETDFVLC